MTTRRDVLLLPAFALLLAACGDEPTTPAPTVPLRLCSDAEFLAHQDGSGRWTPVRGAQGVFEFRGAGRLGLAFAWADRTVPYLVVDYLTAAQAATQYACGTAPALAEQTVQGFIAGRDVDARQVEVAHGSTRVYVVRAESTFRLRPTAEPRDLAAVRIGPGSESGSAADGIILRRALALGADARVALDFAGDETFVPAPRTVRVTAPYAYGAVWFAARGGPEVTVASAVAGHQGDPVTEHALAFAAVPAARTMPGDLHHLLVRDDGRQLHLWRRDLGDIAVRLGDSLATPTFVVAGTSPYVRLDATFAAQPDYDGALMLFYDQFPPANRHVLLTMTREYMGDASPGWRVPMPDLTGVAGLPATVGLAPGQVRWSAWATSRRGPWFPPTRAAADGDEQRDATASGMVP